MTGHIHTGLRFIAAYHMKQLMMMLQVGRVRPIGAPGANEPIVRLVVGDRDGIVHEIAFKCERVKKVRGRGPMA
jgi:hypothetical protein